MQRTTEASAFIDVSQAKLISRRKTPSPVEPQSSRHQPSDGTSGCLSDFPPHTPHPTPCGGPRTDTRTLAGPGQAWPGAGQHRDPNAGWQGRCANDRLFQHRKEKSPLFLKPCYSFFNKRVFRITLAEQLGTHCGWNPTVASGGRSHHTPRHLGLWRRREPSPERDHLFLLGTGEAAAPLGVGTATGLCSTTEIQQNPRQADIPRPPTNWQFHRPLVLRTFSDH